MTCFEIGCTVIEKLGIVHQISVDVTYCMIFIITKLQLTFSTDKWLTVVKALMIVLLNARVHLVSCSSFRVFYST